MLGKLGNSSREKTSKSALFEKKARDNWAICDNKLVITTDSGNRYQKNERSKFERK